MIPTFERFNDRARFVVAHAQEEARALGHQYIGSEHLLMGIARGDEGSDVAVRALLSLGIACGDVRDQIVKVVGRGSGSPPGTIEFTPSAKASLELSLREALGLGHNYIGSAHLLLGILREPEGGGGRVLRELGADLVSVREKVVAGTRPSERPRGPTDDRPRTEPQYELDVLKRIVRDLSELDPASRRRVLRYLDTLYPPPR